IASGLSGHDFKDIAPIWQSEFCHARAPWRMKEKAGGQREPFADHRNLSRFSQTPLFNRA
ncbi:hypothetical protein, partial [Sulfitobacter sp.]|uniref:hypothetical protein n=1 Tax=Sulfitobacter sp. TaxID=1903071 RepID=UPI0035637948